MLPETTIQKVRKAPAATLVHRFFRDSSRTRTQHRGTRTRTRSIPRKPYQFVGSTELTSTRSVSNWFFQSDSVQNRLPRTIRVYRELQRIPKPNLERFRTTDSCLSGFASHYPRQYSAESIRLLTAIDHERGVPDH